MKELNNLFFLSFKTFVEILIHHFLSSKLGCFFYSISRLTVFVQPKMSTATSEQTTKVLNSELVIKFAIKIRVGRRKINLILTRYGIYQIQKKRVPNILYIRNIRKPLFLTQKSKNRVFDPFLVIFVSFITCFVFRKI